MGYRLTAGAHAVDVSAAVGAEDVEVCVEYALGRDVDMPAVGGCRARHEDGLLLDPDGEVVVEAVVELHGCR